MLTQAVGQIVNHSTSKNFQTTDGFLEFSTPSYTPVPDEVFDELLADLSGPELKVLLYIIRRTLGFRKNQDAISMNQMLHGITTKDGRTLDRGCGVKNKNTLLQAIKSLVNKSIIITIHQRSPKRGNLPTLYRLRLKKSASPLGIKNAPRVVQSGYQGLGAFLIPYNMTVYNMTEKQQQLPDQNKSCTSTATKPNVVAFPKAYSPQNPTTTQQTPLPTKKLDTPSFLVQDLTQLGVTEKTAQDLIAQYSKETIQNQIAALSYRKAEEPAAILVKALRENWTLPKRYTDALTQAEQIAKNEVIELQTIQEKETLEKLEAEKKAKIDAHLANLSQSEREILERQAEGRIRQEHSFFRAPDCHIFTPIRDAFVRLLITEQLNFSSMDGTGFGESKDERVKS